jgi:hypothetical protein
MMQPRDFISTSSASYGSLVMIRAELRAAARKPRCRCGRVQGAACRTAGTDESRENVTVTADPPPREVGAANPTPFPGDTSGSAAPQPTLLML